MKRTIAVGALCASLGLAVGTAWAGNPPEKLNQALVQPLAQLEGALQIMASQPADPSGHLKKAVDYVRKAVDELREAMGAAHHPHSHDKE
jgi:hypothetical protein